MAKVTLWGSTDADNNGDYLCRASNGHIHTIGRVGNDLRYTVSTDGGVTFTDGEGGASGTYYTIATATFSYPTQGQYGIITDSSNNIYVFWIDNVDDELYFKKKTAGSAGVWDSGGGTSISDLVVSGGETVKEYLRVEIDTDDDIVITAYYNDIMKVFASTDGGTNWTFEDSVDVGGFVPNRIPDTCLDYNNNLWHVVVPGTNIDVYKITKNSGGSWSIGAKQNIFTGSIVEPAIVAERDSETIWVFQSYYNNPTMYLRYKKYSGGSWDGSWTTIYSEVLNNSYRNLSAVCTYDNNIYVTGTRALGAGAIYWAWDTNSWSTKTTLSTDVLYLALSLEIPENLSSGWNNQLYFVYRDASANYVFDKFELPMEFYGEDNVTLSDAIELNLSREQLDLADGITLSDNILINLNLEKANLGDGLIISDEIEVNLIFQNTDTITLSDAIELNLSREQALLDDTITLSDDIIANLIYHEIGDILNRFSMSYAGDLIDIDNRIRMAHEPTSDIVNNFRMLHSWQVPGDAGFQSLGKEYIKVYINGSADDDVDINSVSITKSLNVPHTASFNIGRPYDTTNKPTIEHEVEIRYYGEGWTNYCLLYKGYITEIVPGDSPESVRINCQDKYWLRNREQKYFFVGHEPQNNWELYYNTVSQGLSACGASFGIGEFIPQTMNFFGRGESDCITSLVENSGNYAWFYDVDGSKKLWIAGQGSIINLERQELDKNIGLYQVLKHRFTESVTNIVNKLRVTIGDKVLKETNEYDGYYYYLDTTIELTPAWDTTYERLATTDYKPAYIASTEEEINQYGKGGTVPQVGTSGVFRHTQEENDLYKNVYTKYNIAFVSIIPGGLEAYTDRFEPKLRIYAPTSSSMKYSGGTIIPTTFNPVVDEGYSIDYKNNTVTFGDRKYFYTEDGEGKSDSIRRPNIKLSIWKKRFQSKSDDPSDDPQDPTSPLVFITSKMGDYPTTIWKSLQLSGLGIQIGGWQIIGYDDDNNPIKELTPSWNDIVFAQDLADWQLSKTADKKIRGSIDLTIDTVCYYGIDLTKRIMIDNVLEDSLNIQSISYNLSNFTVTIGLENERHYKRSISFQSRGV